MIATVRKKIDALLEILLIFLMSVSVLNVLWQVLTRFVLTSPSSYTEELARFLLIWIGVLGAAYAVGKKMHLAIDYFVVKFPRYKRFVETFIALAIMAFASLAMVIGGTHLVYITLKLRQVSAALAWPLGYVYSIVPVSGVLMVFYSICFLTESWSDRDSA